MDKAKNKDGSDSSTEEEEKIEIKPVQTTRRNKFIRKLRMEARMVLKVLGFVGFYAAVASYYFDLVLG